MSPRRIIIGGRMPPTYQPWLAPFTSCRESMRRIGCGAMRNHGQFLTPRLLWFGMLGAAMAMAIAASAPRPNVILIMTDDQGYGELSCHGNPILRTPHLDRLHRSAVRFTDFHVSPTCAPTRAALLTGRHEFRSGVTHTIFERERLRLGVPTLPEALRGNGYATGIFGKWHLGDEDEYQPDRRGFQEVFIHGGGGIGQTYPGSCGDAPGNSYHNPVIRHNGRFVPTRGYCTDVFMDQAMHWMSVQAEHGRPFFAYITPNAPHDPFVSPGPEWERPYAGRGLSTNAVRYYAMIAHFDAAVGRLLDWLDHSELATRTLVIFLTDNGHSVPSLFNAGMRGMKGTAYQGGTRVPSFWSWPGTLPKGVDVPRLSAHIDLFPTLVELTGSRVSRTVRQKWEGRSLAPLLMNQNARWSDRTLFTHLGRWETGQANLHQFKNCAVRTERFRWVNNSELFDLDLDPGESTNVMHTHPAIVARMRRAYARWWREVLPDALHHELARGPEVNPFKQHYWNQLGGGPDDAVLRRMNPDLKFNPKRPPL